MTMMLLSYELTDLNLQRRQVCSLIPQEWHNCYELEIQPDDLIRF